MHEKGWKPLPELAASAQTDLRTGFRNVAKPENRKPQPISRHPLFPAIVALWFAALFGLGSIIVSPALIEHIVLSTGIAKLVPMAAPPLGTTARILFALGLTGLGGLIGLVAARRVAQTAEAQTSQSGTARMPFAGLEPAETDLEPEADPAQDRKSAAMPRRRRAFALVAEEAPRLEEADAAAETDAEVSGNGQPPILNLSDLDLEGIEAAGLTDPALPPEQHAYRQPTLAESDLDTAGALETAEMPESHMPESLAAEWSVANEDEAEIASEARAEEAAPETIGPDVPGPDGFAEDDHGPFGRIPEWLEPRQETHTFSPAAWAVSQDDVPEPAASAPAPETLNNRLFEAYSRSLSEVAETPASEGRPLFSPETAETADIAVSFRAAEELPQAAERIAGADLEDLSQVELLERLALAMEQQRRRRLQAATPDSAPSDGTASEITAPKGTATAEMPAPLFDPASPGTETIAFPAPATSLSTLPRLASVAPFTAPLRPVPDEASPDRESPEQDIVPSATTRIPAALRPVGFDAFGHDEAEDALPGYVPPRHIGLAPARPISVLARTLADAEEAERLGDEAEAEDLGKYAAFDPLSQDFDYAEAPEDDEQEAVLEQGYSSLLNLSRQAPRQNFVRFDENAAPAEAFGEDSGPVEEAHLAEDGGHRPFDPPARPDPSETEKALRAALATLQRMSGAA